MSNISSYRRRLHRSYKPSGGDSRHSDSIPQIECYVKLLRSSSCPFFMHCPDERRSPALCRTCRRCRGRRLTAGWCKQACSKVADCLPPVVVVSPIHALPYLNIATSEPRSLPYCPVAPPTIACYKGRDRTMNHITEHELEPAWRSCRLLAKGEQIIAAPTLIKQLPLPLR